MIRNKMTDDSKPEKELTIYRCPGCGKILFKGLVLKLAIVCPHCNILVRIDGNE